MFVTERKHKKVQRQNATGVQLSPYSFTICSVDNINKRSCYLIWCLLLKENIKKVQRQNAIGVQLSPDSFTICSVDNINKRSCYAYVQSSDLSRGIDGTAVQMVELRPLTIKGDKMDLIPLSLIVLYLRVNRTFIIEKKYAQHLTCHYIESKKMNNDKELIQSDPTSCLQNQKGNN